MKKEKPVHPLTTLVEGLIFSVGRNGLDRKFLLDKVPELTKAELEDILDTLKVKYPTDGTSGIMLTDFGKILSFATHSSNGERIALALERKKQTALTNSVMEVLAVIAYQQPITRKEVAMILEKKAVDYQIDTLGEAGLITEVGRKEGVGNAILYGTTQTFLERFELKSLRKLPSRKDIESRIAIIRQEAEASLMLFNDVDGEDEQQDVDTDIAAINQALDSFMPIGEDGSDNELSYSDADEENWEESVAGADETADYDDTDYESTEDDMSDEAEEMTEEEELYDDEDDSDEGQAFVEDYDLDTSADDEE